MSAPAVVEPDRMARIVAAVRARHAGSLGRRDRDPRDGPLQQGGEAYAEELDVDAAATLAQHSFEFLAAAGPVPRVRTYTVSGPAGEATVLETVLTDRSFIVDTIRECLRAESIEVRHVLHPLLTTLRAPAAAPGEVGDLRGLDAPDDGGHRESLVHVVLEPLPAERRAALEANVAAHLADLVLVTDDYPALVAATEGVITHLEDTRAGAPPGTRR